MMAIVLFSWLGSKLSFSKKKMLTPIDHDNLYTNRVLANCLAVNDKRLN